MIPLAFVSWWYGTGWRSVMSQARQRSQRTLAAFSVPTLARTLFAPWKRIITVPGAGIDAKLHALGDNIVSRAVGFTIRLFVLASALVTLVVMGAIGLVQIAIWPLVPPAIIVCLLKGVIG